MRARVVVAEVTGDGGKRYFICAEVFKFRKAMCNNVTSTTHLVGLEY